MRAPALAVVAAALLVAGCGDEGPSRADWAGDAQRLCASGRAGAAQISDRRRALGAAEDRASFFVASAENERAAARFARSLLDGLELIDHPPDDAIAEWTRNGRRRAATLEALAGAYATRDERAIAVDSEAADALDEANDRAAAALGVRGCAQVL